MDPNSRDQFDNQIKLLKDEFVLFKMELVSKTETQFLNVKSQIALMMEEISHQSETLQAVKSSVGALQGREYLGINECGLDKDDFQPPLVNYQNGLNQHLRLKVVKDEIIHSEVSWPNTSSSNELTKREEFQKENKAPTTTFLKVSNSNFLRTREKENLIQNCSLQEMSHSQQKNQHCQPRIKSCCWTCKSKERLTKQEKKRTRKFFFKVKRLETKVNKCLKFSSTLVENVTQNLLDISEKIDENSFDIEQCWKDMEDIRTASKHVMINGDSVNLEDEISHMNFALEALGLEMEEQSQGQLNLKEIQEKSKFKVTIETKKLELTIRMMNERLQKLENLRDNLNLVLNAKSHDFRRFPVPTAKGTKWKLDQVETQDVMFKCGGSQNISCKLQCLTAMEQYKNMSLEELRHLDYEGLDETSTLELIKNAFKKAFLPVPSNVTLSWDTNGTVRENHKTVKINNALKFIQRKKYFKARRRVQKKVKS